MAKKDYYEILGVDKNSTKENIKKAYKKLALKYHPDRASEEKKKEYEEKFKEISEAYAVLTEDTKRKQYDSFGNNFNQGYSQEDIFRNADFSNIFEELFGNDFFGGSSFDGSFERRDEIRKGRDLRYNLIIDLKEAVFGVEKELKLKTNVKCPTCDGTGAENKELVKCKECGGSGQKIVTKKTPFGIFKQVTVCDVCGGVGKIPKKICKDCNGKGVIKKEKKIKIKIPPGIDNGQILKVKNEGEAIKNGKNGDLLLIINVKPHKIFERRGDDLYIAFPITFSQAALGGKVKIPTFYGDSVIKIPSGIESGTILRLKGKGITNLQGYGKGNQFVKIKIKTPKRLTKKQKKLFAELSKTEKKELKPEKEVFQ